MASVNKAIIIGHLGKDPEVKSLDGGQQLARFSVATSESWTKDGQKQERTEWHRIVAWGKLAEICGRFLSKGKQVYVEGRIQTREYEKDGTKRYSTEIVAQQVTFLGKPNDGRDTGGGQDEPPRRDEGDDVSF
jgi:single-strand DNA-binding protein